MHKETKGRISDMKDKDKKNESFRFITGATSDVSWEAYGKDIKEVFENSAKALFTVMCRIDKVKPKKAHEFEVSADSADELLLNWLQTLIASVDIDGMFYSEFEITKISDLRLKAVCRGEPITPGKGNTVVKAVTYHNFELKKTEEGYTARIVVDI
jgi:SHS2 domain-containing protein